MFLYGICFVAFLFISLLAYLQQRESDKSTRNLHLTLQILERVKRLEEQEAMGADVEAFVDSGEKKFIPGYGFVSFAGKEGREYSSLRESVQEEIKRSFKG